jgi:hypothetical protein
VDTAAGDISSDGTVIHGQRAVVEDAASRHRKATQRDRRTTRNKYSRCASIVSVNHGACSPQREILVDNQGVEVNSGGNIDRSAG